MDAALVPVASPVEVVTGLLANGVGVAASAALCLSYYGACAGVKGVEWASGLVSDGAVVREMLVPLSDAVCDGGPVSACVNAEQVRAAVDGLAGRLGGVVESTRVVGKNWASNRRKKQNRRDKKRRSSSGGTEFSSFSSSSGGVNYAKEMEEKKKSCTQLTLQASLEAKWKAENALAVKQAERKLQLLEARDFESESRMQRAQIMSTTEAAKVQTERAYATLKRTGNVPGFAETVSSQGRSDGTCISPDSSVSQQEIRAMMKELEDCKLTLRRIERDNPALVAHHMEGHGVKTAFTLDSEGMSPVDEPGSLGADGKYHLDSYDPNPKFYKDRFNAEVLTDQYFNRE